MNVDSDFPFFTIAIPAFKDSFLKECIDSILAQSYTQFEIVLVNDASPYDLDTIILSYNDSRIRYYKNERNFGAVNVVKNWNKCLEYAKGDFIICMGDDDKLLPNCLEEYVSLIEKYPGLGVYHAWTILIDENSNFKGMTSSRCPFESIYSLIWHRWNERRNQFIGDFLFKTDYLRINGGFYFLPLAWGSDDITAAIAAKKQGIANTQKPCFCYRINTQTISKTGDLELKMQAICGEFEWYKDFLKDKPNDDLDIKYWICLKSQLLPFFERKKALNVAMDLGNKSLFRIFYWYKKRNIYKITQRALLYALYEGIKIKLSNK